MAKHATFSLQISTAVHVSGIFAVLAWGSYQEQATTLSSQKRRDFD